jgi:glycine cleavage system protein P-like pyridoxal-binding family
LPFAASYLTETSTCRGAAEEVGELSMMRHYKDLERDYIYVAVAIETLGSWGMEALSFIKTIGKKIFTSTDEIKSTSNILYKELVWQYPMSSTP